MQERRGKFRSKDSGGEGSKAQVKHGLVFYCHRKEGLDGCREVSTIMLINNAGDGQ